MNSEPRQYYSKALGASVYPDEVISYYEDLFQIGCIGLCKAAATDRGGCFSTYAYQNRDLYVQVDLDALNQLKALEQEEKEALGHPGGIAVLM